MTTTRRTLAALGWALTLSLSALGCSEVTSPAPDASADGGVAADGAGGDADTSDAGGADGGASDAGGGAAKWWTCSTWEGATGTKTPRLSGCEQNFDDSTYGCKAPWYGVKQGGVAYSCNRCRGGDPKAQAQWRAVDFATEDPSKPLSGNHKEVLTIDGNTWHLQAEHTDSTGKVHTVRVDGWYWCSDGAELKTESLVFHATHKEGSDLFGWFAPDVFTGLFLTKGADQLAWSYNEGFETKKAGDALYCRVGSTIKGKPCGDPFK